jgi:hypothetical protein
MGVLSLCAVNSTVFILNEHLTAEDVQSKGRNVGRRGEGQESQFRGTLHKNREIPSQAFLKR